MSSLAIAPEQRLIQRASEPILEIRDLRVTYGSGQKQVAAVRAFGAGAGRKAEGDECDG